MYLNSAKALQGVQAVLPSTVLYTVHLVDFGIAWLKLSATFRSRLKKHSGCCTNQSKSNSITVRRNVYSGQKFPLIKLKLPGEFDISIHFMNLCFNSPKNTHQLLAGGIDSAMELIPRRNRFHLYENF